MKTTSLTNSNNQKLEVGSKVKTHVYGGCEVHTTITALRPKSQEVVIAHRGLYKKIDHVELETN